MTASSSSMDAPWPAHGFDALVLVAEYLELARAAALKVQFARHDFREHVVLVGDPARRQLVTNAILAVNAPKIIYVSCEPNSLVRDLHQLIYHGYRILRLQPFDMFPQTEQVENVVMLEK